MCSKEFTGTLKESNHRTGILVSFFLPTLYYTFSLCSEMGHIWPIDSYGTAEA